MLTERWPSLVVDLVSPLVISAGSCGALAPGLEVGGLVIPESLLDPRGRRLNVTPGVHAAAVRVAKGGGPQAGREMDDAWTGLLLTSSDLVATPEAKALRWRATGASAVDMESAVIVAWASSQGCPSLVVRAVSDTAGQQIPAELVGLMTPEGKLRTGRAMALALTRPGTIPHALALRRGTALALKRIARLLAAFTSSLAG
jgi:adenosylhomocysteine nucleosidase